MSTPISETHQETPALLETSPYFDGAAVAKHLATTVEKAGGLEEAHNDITKYLRAIVKSTRERARQELISDGDGIKCATTLSHVQDVLIRTIFDLALKHTEAEPDKSTTQQSDPATPRLAIVATGGYGRGLLAPGSDIDLLFLVPTLEKDFAETIAQKILYVLWDLGFKVGHATRNISQALKLAKSDVTICTSMIDARFLDGNDALFDRLEQRLRNDVLNSTKREFVEAKLSERDKRHRQSGDARYMVEPNVKDGKGGLRDLHTLQWLSKVIYDEEVGPSSLTAGIFTAEEVVTFRRCENFLWTIRCFLHFATGRAEERLSFDIQSEMAEMLGYKRHGGLRAVERFMKHYFLVAKDVGDLTTILCSALEMVQLKETSRISSMMPTLNWKKRREVRRKSDFRFDNDRINIVDADVFKRDPLNILRLFVESARADAYLHPDAIRQLRQSIRLIDKQFRDNPQANKIFLEILTATRDPAATLRRMNDAGVLGRFILPFRRVVGMMQFNMYHHYTVDEHLIRTVAMLTDIENGGAAAELPLSTKLFSTVRNRRVLFLAAFLHDIGKGRKEDHSIIGERITRKLCPRFGFSKAETDTTSWLVQEHLTMSNTAQSRDPSDPKTIRDLAETCKSLERLKLLLLLTVADIRAVGPGTWNGWKGQLLRTLYAETELLLAGSHSREDRRDKIASSKQDASRALQKIGWSQKNIEKISTRFYPHYWLRFETPTIVQHAQLLERVSNEEENLAISHTTNKFTAITELTILAPNHARLLSLFAGACAAAGANISGAQITTTRDGFAIDNFLLQRKFDDDEDEHRQVKRIQKLIKKLLRGEERMRALLEKRRLGANRVEAFEVEPEVMINNALSDNYTVIEVAGRDRPGLLYDLTTALSEMNIDISSAHITTFGEKAVDVFYVTDLLGKKLSIPSREKALADRLEQILANTANVPDTA